MKKSVHFKSTERLTINKRTQSNERMNNELNKKQAVKLLFLSFVVIAP
jgi:hypothetical protein